MDSDGRKSLYTALSNTLIGALLLLGGILGGIADVAGVETVLLILAVLSFSAILSSDGVMGGMSDGALTSETINGREATRLRGRVSTENNGGFIQMTFDINASGAPYDARRWSGIELDVLGNNEAYETRLRTSDLDKPWQSFRFEFLAASAIL